MQRTIRSIAAGAAMMCLALLPSPAAASDQEVGAAFDDPAPAPLVEASMVPDATVVAPEQLTFVWTTDLSLAPPPYVTASMDSHLTPPSASSPAIPLPPAAWSGFASLAALGAIAYVRRLRRTR